MHLGLPSIRFISRLARSETRRWRRAWTAWGTVDKEPWIFASFIILIVGAFGLALNTVFAHRDEKRTSAREEERRHLTCLARNVFFEARGEPVAGQLAVAHVTMNRRASSRFPKSICDVVHQQSWDPLRKRYVGAFSWTELDSLPVPTAAEWEQAWKVAEAVYYGRELSNVEGALFYHATYIRPDWAKHKRPIARIGKHVFYR
jgi:spore germination cell wall hydrolase CwlJ-like protein